MVLDLESAREAERVGERLAGFEVVAIEEVVIDVADARAVVTHIRPSHASARSDVEHVWVKRAAAAADRHAGEGDRTAT